VYLFCFSVSRSRTWITLALNDEQAVQALVFAQSLRRVLTTWRLVVLTNNSISKSSRYKINSHNYFVHSCLFLDGTYIFL